MFSIKDTFYPIFLTILFLPTLSLAQTTSTDGPPTTQSPVQTNNVSYLHYSYPERDHELGESVGLLAALYPIGWIGYYFTQKSTFENRGSWKNYRSNFGQLVFDKDGPIWNWVVHPTSGSQIYLFFRANGYSRWESFFMTAIEEALFEFTTEIYTEPASFQDLYQTPVLGSIFGMAIETASMGLLNSGVGALKVLGHIINPATLFWFYKGEILITPTLSRRNNKPNGLELSLAF